MRFNDRWFQRLTVLSLLALVACGGGGGGNSGSGGGGSSNTPPLEITTTSLPDGIAGQPYNGKVAATGGVPPYTWGISRYSQIPLELRVESDGTVDGASNYVVSEDITFYVNDSGSPRKNATKTLHINFLQPFDIYTSDLPGGHTNVSYDAIIQSDGAVQSWQMTTGQLPPGLQLTNSSQSQIEVMGTPSAAGTFNFTIQATSTDNPPRMASKDFSIVIDSNAAITTSSLPDLITQNFYDVTLSAVNGTPPYHWSVLDPGLPNGLTLNASTGQISGTYRQGIYQNPYPLVFKVADSATNPTSSTRSLPLHMLEALSVFGSYDQNATQWQQFDASLYVSGGTAPYAWSITSGSLPPGLKIDQNGHLSGTPTTLGTFYFTVQVADSTNPQQIVQTAQSVTVSPPVLVVVGSLPQRLPLNVPFDGVIAAQGGTPPYTWSISNGSLPPGLQLNTSTGEVSGTPTTLGRYFFYGQVVDSASQSAYAVFQIVVDPALGRNDTIAKSTPIGNGYTGASLSPYADPIDTANPDTDYYKIYANPGSTVDIRVNRAYEALDPVLELLDANGARLNTCNLPPLFIGSFTSSCVNDDINPGIDRDSELQFKPSGSPGTQTIFYAHVLDWRGDARPDMAYSITISGALDALTISFEGLLGEANRGVNYSAQLTTTGGTGTVTWSVIQGSLPPGLSLTPSGLITGAPTATGNFDFTVQAKDSGNPPQATSSSLSLKVADPLKITNLNQIPAGCAMQPFDYQLVATGGIEPYSWSLSGDIGANLGINWQTGEVKGTPSAAGTYQLNAGVQDYYSKSDNESVSWTVNNCQ